MLKDGYIVRSVRDEGHAARYAEFNAAHNGRSEGATCDCLLRHHPDMRELVDVLFPRMKSYLRLPYHRFGGA